MTVPEDMKITDLIDLAKLQEMQDAFAAAANVGSVITDINGCAITRPSNFCRLCSDIIRKTELGCKNCMQSDAIIGRSNPDGPIMQPCLSGGLWDGGASISVGDRHIANWLIGQVRNSETPLETIMEYAVRIGVDADLFREALLEVNVMSTEQFAKVCHSLFLMANQISDLAYKNFELRKSEANLKSINKQLHCVCIATVGALANSLEAKDAYTKGHCERVRVYSIDIAKAMGMEVQEILELEFAAMLHDIGKIGVQHEVLNKDESFNVDDYPSIKNHPMVGYGILEGVEFLENSRNIILQHHEHIDGSGYPMGIKGEQILLAARILSVADAFDAMTSQRPYRMLPLSLDMALSELRKYAGTHFDSRVVETAIAVFEL